ncbi:MAG: sortase [Oscillospiraceae bacterium]|nr:sortase [Oscillospiraceae bacterium]
MRRKLGNLCIFLGAVLLAAALLLLGYNCWDAARAGNAAEEILPALLDEMPDEPTVPDQPLGTPVEYLDEDTLTMTEAEIDGERYIGWLDIPAIELELPVMSEWSYSRLKTAPCRYSGTVRGEDLVLLGHNYTRHFGKLDRLRVGDEVLFTDMDGVVYRYEVAARDVLDADAVAEMTAGEYDLTLFTCDATGARRITVYCDMVK